MPLPSRHPACSLVALAVALALAPAGASAATGAPPAARIAGRAAVSALLERVASATVRLRHAPRVAATPVAQITGAACFGVARTTCRRNRRVVQETGELRIYGHHLASHMNVLFARWSGRTPIAQAEASLRMTRHGYAVTVPKNVRSGSITLVMRSGVRSKPYGPITILPAPRPPAAVAAPTLSAPLAASAAAFDAPGMWIWYLDRSDGGNLTKIAQRAAAAGIRTLFIKSSDGSSNFWSQFTPQLVASVHALGLRVCAWQYVYGSHPYGEAQMGIEAVRDGADCLVIDAESEYEGNYAAAQTYIEDLRAGVGASYPVGLASFPYVNYHEALPYSVFLGPGGAQFNVPQVYWGAIGTTPDAALAQTYLENRVYGRTIVPLGQTYGGVPKSQIIRFRELAAAYGAPGVSWWSWQSTSAGGWDALDAPLSALSGVSLQTGSPVLGKGARGDQVVWMQEHLAAAEPRTPTSGVFDSVTVAQLKAFQASRGIAASGVTDAATWSALLALTPVAVRWAHTTPPHGGGTGGTGGATGATGSSGSSGSTGATGTTGATGASGASGALAGTGTNASTAQTGGAAAG